MYVYIHCMSIVCYIKPLQYSDTSAYITTDIPTCINYIYIRTFMHVNNTRTQLQQY